MFYICRYCVFTWYGRLHLVRVKYIVCRVSSLPYEKILDIPPTMTPGHFAMFAFTLAWLPHGRHAVRHNVHLELQQVDAPEDGENVQHHQRYQPTLELAR